jgi:hypothetical protein
MGNSAIFLGISFLSKSKLVDGVKMQIIDISKVKKRNIIHTKLDLEI